MKAGLHLTIDARAALRAKPYWSLPDCAEWLGVSARVLGDMMREGEAPVPKPFGKVGASQLWDPAQFRAAVPRR